MGFPARALGDDEEVLLALHPHWKRLTLPVLCVPVVVGIASYLLFLLPQGRLRTDLRWAIVGVALLGLLRLSAWPVLRWRATHYVVTTQRVILRTGVLAKVGRDVPLSRINDVSFRRTLLERMLGCGTLVIESGGEQGRVVLPEVPGVELVQREIHRAIAAPVNRGTVAL